jgi:hypothetical protein
MCGTLRTEIGGAGVKERAATRDGVGFRALASAMDLANELEHKEVGVVLAAGSIAAAFRKLRQAARPD